MVVKETIFAHAFLLGLDQDSVGGSDALDALGDSDDGQAG